MILLTIGYWHMHFRESSIHKSSEHNETIPNEEHLCNISRKSKETEYNSIFSNSEEIH